MTPPRTPQEEGDPLEATTPTAEPVDEIAGREPGYVPHHLPGTNKAIEEYAAKYHMPVEAAGGGAETALPEFAAKMKTMKVPAPEKK